MKSTLTVVLTFFTLIVFLPAQDVIFSDDFESGVPSDQWQLFWADEEAIQAVDMATVPAPLDEGGSYAGFLQDADGTYTGAALAVAGDVSSQNYTITADVYCYVNNPGGSAYTGVVAYADSSQNYYVKLVADFDGDNRLRLYNNIFDMQTFQYSFSNSIDATGLYTEDGWHTMSLEVETLEDSTVSYTVYFDNQWVGGPFIDDSDGHAFSGSYGVFSFQMSDTGLAGYYDNVVVTVPAPPENYLFQDDFETGFPADDWFEFWPDEELIEGINNSDAPALLGNGGEYVGFLQDADGSYTGAALSAAGNLSDQNYTVQADVYCYSNNPGGSAYTGIVAYADSAANYYVKLVADFDADNRLRLYNNDFDMETFQYSFSHSIDATGLYDGDGWHNMALEVETLEDSTVSYSVYFDGEMVGGPFIDDSDSRTLSGYYGVFSFQMSDVGIAGYFDNFSVLGSAPEILYGDLNSDGVVDILDVVTVVSIIMGNTTPDDYQLQAGDVNGDGNIDILDVVSMVSMILGRVNQGSPISNAAIKVSGDAILLTADGDLAGIQLQVRGAFELSPENLPAGWNLEYSPQVILLYSVQPASGVTSLRLPYTGDVEIVSSIVADWYGHGIQAETALQPGRISLAAYPNPFNPQTNITYRLTSEGPVTISVYDLRGRLIQTLLRGNGTEGAHSVVWNAAGEASGTYLVKISTDTETAVQKIMLLK
ncbi:MAG: T9SS type A sorting domain-containing protein [FCB group bacterium]|nr:T9SS type A sorting domain-containing protein [FCB group bacterium]